MKKNEKEVWLWRINALEQLAGGKPVMLNCHINKNGQLEIPPKEFGAVIIGNTFDSQETSK